MILTEKQLNQIFYLSKEKKMWEDKLKSLTEVKAMGYENTGTGKGLDISSPVMQLAEQREKIRDIISAKLEEISFAEKEILEYIDAIDDSLIRQIMMHRHIELKSWAQIAKELSSSSTPDSLRMMHNRYIKEHL